MKVLMSGPIRPNQESVIQVIQSIKQQFNPDEFFLSCWKGHLTDELRREVTHAEEVDEPTESYIQTNITARTKQQRSLHPELEKWTFSIYRMINGVQNVCKLARPYCKDDDIVIRIRTDSVFLIEPSYIPVLLNHAKTHYVVRHRKSSGTRFDDWFAITTYKQLVEGWTFEDYNTSIDNAWNAEQLIYTNICSKNIPMFVMDEQYVECYINRPNNKRNYHP